MVAWLKFNKEIMEEDDHPWYVQIIKYMQY